MDTQAEGVPCFVHGYEPYGNSQQGGQHAIDLVDSRRLLHHDKEGPNHAVVITLGEGFI